MKVMSDYRLRDMFKNDFEMLHTRFFQLERLLEVRDWVASPMEMNAASGLLTSPGGLSKSLLN